MYLTLTFEDKKTLDIQTDDFDSFDQALGQLKERYVNHCFDCEEEKEVESIELNDCENLKQIDFSEFQSDWSDALHLAFRNCAHDRREQRAIRSDYRAGLL